jgi:hypothetical protein
VLAEDGALVPKYFGDTSLIFMCIYTVRSIDAVRYIEHTDLKVHGLHSLKIIRLKVCFCVVEGLVKSQKS